MSTLAGRARALPALLLVAAALLTGCGSEDGDSERVADSPTPAGPTEPAESTEPTEPSGSESSSPASPAAGSVPECAEVWVEGGTLPRRYDGCLEDGARVPAKSRACSIGTRLFTHADRFYAVPGGPVQEAAPVLLEDPDYRQVLATCTG